MTAGQTSSFKLLEKVQPGGCLFYDVVNMGGPSKGPVICAARNAVGNNTVIFMIL